jgi:hypothetical protein
MTDAVLKTRGYVQDHNSKSPVRLSMIQFQGLIVHSLWYKNNDEGIARRFNFDHYLRCLHRLNLRRTTDQPTACSMVPRFDSPMRHSNPPV